MASECVNCGELNHLGDCCPLCAIYECDGCNEEIDFDCDFYDDETDARLCEGCAIGRVLA